MSARRRTPSAMSAVFSLGEEDVFDDDSDLFDDSDDFVAEIDIELDLGESEVDAFLTDQALEGMFDSDEDDELGDMDPEEWEELVSDEVDIGVGRRDMANRIRTADHSVSDTQDAYRQGLLFGYVQSLRDQGVDDHTIQEVYGGTFGILGLIGKGAAGLGRLIAAGGKGFLSQGVPGRDPSAPGLARQAGVVARERLSEYIPELAPSSPREISKRLGPGAAGVASDVSDFPSVDAGAEADHFTLPNVYIEDESGFEEDFFGQSSMLRDTDLKQGLMATDRFGAMAEYGFVEGQHRLRAKTAARKAVSQGHDRLVSVGPLQSAPFVEDPDARPVLYGDGRIWEPVYGRMTVIPCPGCSRVNQRAAFNGVGSDCMVCDGYGSVLIPDSDVPSWVATSHYGILPLLIPLATTLATKKGREKARRFFASVKDRFQRRQDEVEEEGLEEASEMPNVEESEVGRALVPMDRWPRYAQDL